MEEAEDINRVDNDINDNGVVPEESGAIGGTEPEQSARAQQATANELKRLGSRNPQGLVRVQGWCMAQDEGR